MIYYDIATQGLKLFRLYLTISMMVFNTSTSYTDKKMFHYDLMIKLILR
jgi:hypothetical protein